MKKKILQNKKRNIIYGIAAVWILGIAWSGNPPDGRTGAPGNGLCSDCHSQNPPAAFDGNLMVDFPADIMANQTYTLTVTANNPDGAAMRAGFQMTILDSNDDQAGTMANASGGSTVTSTGGRQYHEHNPAQNYGGGTSVSWTVDWTAPAGPDMENITWYAAGIVANGSGGNSGDLLVQSTGSRTLTGGGNPLSVGTTNIVDADCFGAATGSAEAEATGGMEPFTFNWSNGQTNAALMNVVAGTYIVSVTDNLGQMSTAEAVIDEPNELQIVSIVENVDCAGNMNGFIDVAMSAGGTGAYSYNWNTGATTNTLENLAGGTYILTLTDANGCELIEAIVVNEPDAIQMSLTEMENVDCFGESNGSATFEADGGVGGFTYAWSNGFNGPTQTGLAMGTYTVTVTDANNCTNESIVFINEPSELLIEANIVDDALCFGDATGGIEVGVEGGTGDLAVEWSNGASGTTILNLEANTYVATVTDDNGCTKVLAVDVGEPDELIVSVQGLIPISCFGENDATVVLSVTGGTVDGTPEQYIINWSNGNTGTTGENLSPGIYTVEVEDVNVCTDMVTFEIVEPDLLTSSASSTDETAAGAMDGTAMVDVMGGVEPYSFIWSNGANTQSVNGLGTGMYTVLVEDANGCIVSDTVVVMSAGCALTASMTTTDVNCFGDFSGTASLNITGANDPISIEWSTGESTNNIESIPAGAYTATITDAANCTFTVSGNVNQPDQLSDDCIAVNPSGMGSMDGSVDCNISGGTLPYSYLWSTGDTTEDLTNLAAGQYSYTVTDANGCILEDSVSLSQFECALSFVFSQSNISCFGQADGMAGFDTIVNALEPLTYSWSNGSVQAIQTDLGPGDYSVVVTDANGCEINETFMITQPTQVMASVDSVDNTSGGNNNGQIFISPSGGVPPYTYSWVLNNEQVSEDQNPDSLAAGLYQVNVIDASGCVGGQSDILVQGSTSIVALDPSDWSIYPNPVESIIYFEQINGGQPSAIKSVRVIDALGNQVMQLKPVGASVDMSMSNLNVALLPKGLYVLEVTTLDGRLVEQFVKM